MGVFRAVERERYGETVRQQIQEAVAKKGEGDLQGLIRGTDTWTVT
jgi:2-oxoglutarate ferredoxin oxidoreductase subunit beta